MNKKILALIICLGALSVQSISAQNSPGAVITTDNAQNRVSNNSSRGYTVGTGDEITVRVTGEPNFDGIYTVDENGEIQLASVPDPIFVGCKTEKEIRGQIIKLYLKYLVNPQINVQFSKRTSRPPAMVYGAVVTPQQYDLRRPARLGELLSYSGGVLSEGASGRIQITHSISSSPNFCKDSNENIAAQPYDPTKNLTTSIRYSDLIAGVESANPLILSGDRISVERAKPVYIIGEVRAPQNVYLQEDGTTLTTVIGQVGGVSTQAKTKDIKIYRVREGMKDREQLSFNYDKIRSGAEKDVLLQPYDIVEVDRAKPSALSTVIKLATGAGATAIGGLGATLPQRILY